MCDFLEGILWNKMICLSFQEKEDLRLTRFCVKARKSLRERVLNKVLHKACHSKNLEKELRLIEEKTDILYSYTPYLRMQTNGNIGVVDYAEPGTEQLFQNFYDKYDEKTKVYLLKNHGVFVSGEDILKTFYLLEEFEETARIVNNIENHIYNKIGWV